jgi:hypothetical protein
MQRSNIKTKLGDYEIIQINANEQNAAAGVGYLFIFDRIAANLGRQSGADGVVVGDTAKAVFCIPTSRRT